MSILLAILLCPPFPPEGEAMVWTLPEGCPAPYELQAYTNLADLIARQKAEARRVEVVELRRDLDACRSDRDALAAKAAGKLDAGALRVSDVARDLAAVPIPPEAPSRPLWAGLGAGAAVACGAAAFVVLDGSEAARGVGAGLAAAGCGGVVVGLGGLLE